MRCSVCNEDAASAAVARTGGATRGEAGARSSAQRQRAGRRRGRLGAGNGRPARPLPAAPRAPRRRRGLHGKPHISAGGERAALRGAGDMLGVAGFGQPIELKKQIVRNSGETLPLSERAGGGAALVEEPGDEGAAEETHAVKRGRRAWKGR
jgi:hypothetical protein